jgi:ABC-2 type transport system ATP-binding protein
MTPAVHAIGLTKRYGMTVAVSAVDLQIEPGAIFGLVGPNGAGKTTMLKMLATLLEPSAGSASVCGLDVQDRASSVRRIIGYMPDTFGVYDDMRVWEYLDFFARIYVIAPDRRRVVISELLELVDLAGKRDAYVHSLSRGMQQRLCLAHALVHEPQVLLLDEPASGLDPRARAELRELLRELSRMGKTIVISSHILPELEELVTGVAIIDRGRVLAAGSVPDIQARFRQGQVIRVRVLGGTEALQAAHRYFATQPDVVSVVPAAEDRLDLAISAGDDGAAALLYRAMSEGHRVAAFAPVASDLEELFLQITAPAGIEAA